MKQATKIPIVNLHCAGIDVGSRKMFVSIAGAAPQVFGCCTEDLQQLRDWLLSQGVRSVAMEATGVYWLCLYGMLEEAGLEVLVVNGAHVKNVPGRKSDMQDCQWLAQLHAHGLLRSGFVPPSEIRRLRDYQRLRSDLVSMAATHVQHMQKALERLNIKVHTVISSITGYSGLRMIEAILAGERDSEKLVALCDEQILRNKRGAVCKALQGNWQAEHLFALKLAWEAWQFYQQQIQACDQELGRRVEQLAAQKPVPTLGPRKELRNNAPRSLPRLQQHLGQIYGADLTRIPGINEYTVLLLLSEVGWDMSRWPSAKHFTAWLGLAPSHHQSGQRRRNQKRFKGRAGRIFCLAAYSMATAKKSWLSSFYRRLRALRGGQVALKATARKLAQLFYLILTKGWDYVEQGVAAYEEKHRRMQMQRLKRLARELGMAIVPTAA